jgi:hypothetical protein
VAAACRRGTRLARGRVESGSEELLPAGVTIDGLLAGPSGAFGDTLAGPADGPVPTGLGQPSQLAARRCGRPGDLLAQP